MISQPMVSQPCYQWLSGFEQDCIRVTAPNQRIIGNTIIDTCGDEPGISAQAHRDAIQLIPTNQLPRGQYAAALLDGVEIARNHIRSRGLLQGIFCSDGLLNDVRIYDNVIQTEGKHFITLSGLLTGEIHGNLDTSGKPCPLLLTPLRIGGNPGIGNVWILSFSDPQISYLPLEYLADEKTQAYTTDLRQMPVQRDTNLYNFDLAGFRQAAAKLQAAKDVLEHSRQLQALAMEYGET